MTISRKLWSLARTLSLVTPLAVAAVSVSAAPVDILSASCAANSSAALPADPSNCTSATSEGHVTEYLQYFSNGFTLSLFANGTAWTSGSQGGAFTLDAEVPVTVNIGGPSRNLVVYGDTSQSETLNSSSDAVGQILYGFNHSTVISQTLEGSDPITFNNPSSNPTSMETWTSDAVSSHNFGLSMQLSSSLTAGSLFGSISESETFRFYEADGVTPVNLLVAETPEPASWLLLLGGLPACCLIAHRRRSSKLAHNEA